jgi:hypothetical protein
MKKILIIAAIALIAANGICNYPVTYTVNVGGKQVEKRMPLYVKAGGFYYRNWMYKDLVREIVGREDDAANKVLAILSWTNKNITVGTPKGAREAVDYPLDVITRRYGTEEQIEDVFTTLCSYAGLSAGYDTCYNSDRSKGIILSFVKIDGRWLMFDASIGKHFVNKQGKVASVSDSINGNIALSDKEAAVYKEYLDSIKNIK